MENRNPADLQKQKESLGKSRTVALTKARVLDLQEKLIQLEIDTINVEGELAKMKQSLADAEKALEA